MRNFLKFVITFLCSLTLLGCGVGDCPPDNDNLSLKLVAPYEYPAGVAVTAYLTMYNTSNVNATNLTYEIDSSNNTTGVNIDVSEANTKCPSINANSSCTFPAYIPAGSKPGSFTVIASSNSSALNKVVNEVKAALSLHSTSISLTANIGLTNIPMMNANGNSANGIYPLYQSVQLGTANQPTVVSIVAYIESVDSSRPFDAIKLTNGAGTSLNYSIAGTTSDGNNFNTGGMVTFNLVIPAGVTDFNFYISTYKSGSLVDVSSLPANGWPISVTNSSSSQGVLMVQPTLFALSNESASSNKSQILTYTNIGSSTITGISPTITDPAITMDNNCTNGLPPNASCLITVTTKSVKEDNNSGSIVASYNNGTTSSAVPAIANFTVTGESTLGLSLSSLNTFTASTVSPTESQELTLTNTGNAAESNFVFSFSPNNYFSIASGGSLPCSGVSGNNVTTTLASGASCTIIMTYNNATIASGSTTLTVNYNYNGHTAQNPATQSLSYSTTQASAVLTSDFTSWNAAQIIANNSESVSKTFTITNSGSDAANSVVINIVGNGSSFFSNKSTTCGSSLAVNSSCTVTVAFGPSATVESGISANLQIAYNSQTGGVETPLSVSMTGSTRAPNTANIQIGRIRVSSGSGGGSGSESLPFYFESTAIANSSAGYLRIRYYNFGESVATKVTVESSTIPNGYTLVSNGCNGVEVAPKDWCNVDIRPSAVVGTADFTFAASTLPVSYNDEAGTHANQSVVWYTNGDINGPTTSDVYALVYPQYVVNTWLSLDPNSTTPSYPTLESVPTNSTVYVIFQSSGGYNPDEYQAWADSGSLPSNINCNNNETCYCGGSNNGRCMATLFTTGPSVGSNIPLGGTVGSALSPSNLVVNVVGDAPTMTIVANSVQEGNCTPVTVNSSYIYTTNTGFTLSVAESNLANYYFADSYSGTKYSTASCTMEPYQGYCIPNLLLCGVGAGSVTVTGIATGYTSASTDIIFNPTSLEQITIIPDSSTLNNGGATGFTISVPTVVTNNVLVTITVDDPQNDYYGFGSENPPYQSTSSCTIYSGNRFCMPPNNFINYFDNYLYTGIKSITASASGYLDGSTTVTLQYID